MIWAEHRPAWSHSRSKAGRGPATGDSVCSEDLKDITWRFSWDLKGWLGGVLCCFEQGGVFGALDGDVAVMCKFLTKAKDEALHMMHMPYDYMGGEGLLHALDTVSTSILLECHRPFYCNWTGPSYSPSGQAQMTTKELRKIIQIPRSLRRGEAANPSWTALGFGRPSPVRRPRSGLCS